MRSASTLARDAKKCARHAQAHTKTRMQQARTQHARNHTSRVGEHLNACIALRTQGAHKPQHARTCSSTCARSTQTLTPARITLGICPTCTHRLKNLGAPLDLTRSWPEPLGAIRSRVVAPSTHTPTVAARCGPDTLTHAHTHTHDNKTNAQSR